MRWRSDPLRCVAAAFVAAAVLPAPAISAQADTFVPQLDVKTLAREAGVGRGISEAAGPVVLVDSDGKRHRVVRGPSGLALEPAPDVVPEPAPAPDMLPDGIVTRGTENIRRAWLFGPTDRYAHGVLGDAIEASGLVLQRFDGKVFRYATDSGSVFEDRLVRLADLDGDGWDEAIVVQSYLTRGSALAVFSLGENAVRFVSEVPPIGKPLRWLNPAGAADYNGDGIVELAYVETPHIGGTLKLYAFVDRRLVPIHEMDGFSNHALGSRIQDMVATLDWDNDGVPDLALPDTHRRALRIVTFSGGTPRELARVPNPVSIVTAVLPARLSEQGPTEIVYGLSNGTLVAVRP